MSDRAEFVDLQVSHLLALAKQHAARCPPLARYYLEKLQRLATSKKLKLAPVLEEQACPYCSSLLALEHTTHICGCAQRRQLAERRAHRTKKTQSARGKKHALKVQVSQSSSADKALTGSGLKSSTFFQVPETKRPLDGTRVTPSEPPPKRFSFSSHR